MFNIIQIEFSTGNSCVGLSRFGVNALVFKKGCYSYIHSDRVDRCCLFNFHYRSMLFNKKHTIGTPFVFK